MRATFNTLFGRLFGVLLVAIVLAHVPVSYTHLTLPTSDLV